MKIRHAVYIKDHQTDQTSINFCETISLVAGLLDYYRDEPMMSAFHTVEQDFGGMFGSTLSGMQLAMKDGREIESLSSRKNPIWAICDDHIVRQIWVSNRIDSDTSALGAAELHGPPHYVVGILRRINMPMDQMASFQPTIYPIWQFDTDTGFGLNFRQLAYDPRLKPENNPHTYWCPQCDSLYDPRTLATTNGRAVCTTCMSRAKRTELQISIVHELAQHDIRNLDTMLSEFEID